METGLIFALLSAVFFAASTLFVRRGVYKAGESSSALLISMFIGVGIFSLIMVYNAEWGEVWSLSWQGWALLAGAGIMHLAFGRFLSYIAVRLIGANRGMALTRTNTLYAVILGIVLLKEALNTSLALGVLCILSGVTLVSIEKQSPGAEEQSETSRMLAKGVISGLGAGLCWGISGILIKLAYGEISSPFAGAFVSYVTATIIISGILFRKQQREQLVRLPRPALLPLTLAGVLITFAQLFRYAALRYSPISLAQPLMSTNILFLLLFSFLLNRRIEVFTTKVILGMVLTAVGGFLISY